MIALETAISTPKKLKPYELSQNLPFAFAFAQRRTIGERISERGATDSDGSTSGNDGSNPSDNEEFDWIKDD